MLCYILSNGYYCWTQKGSQAGQNKWSLTEGAIIAWVCCLTSAVCFSHDWITLSWWWSLWTNMSTNKLWSLSFNWQYFFKSQEYHSPVTFKNMISGRGNVLCVLLLHFLLNLTLQGIYDQSPEQQLPRAPYCPFFFLWHLSSKSCNSTTFNHLQ